LNKKRLAVVGATGSIGRSTLDICRMFPDRFEVKALAVRSNLRGLKTLEGELKPKFVVIYEESAARNYVPLFDDTIVLTGKEGLKQLVWEDLDHIVFASSGTDAIPALMMALTRKIEVSLANKESLVVGGPWVMKTVNSFDQLRPIDSEHSAIWQCLLGEEKEGIEDIILTASGGPFLHATYEEMKSATPEIALKHPTWSMGAKITIDSATLFNKGLEIIEACYLFSMPLKRVKAVIQPNSLIHGCVRFCDGSSKLLSGKPDMRIPISFALSYPKRLKLDEAFHRPQIVDWNINFLAIDEKKFPCYGLARRALQMGNAYPPILVGADEAAVEAFLAGIISMVDIFPLLERTLLSYNGPSNLNSLEEAVLLVDFGRSEARRLSRLFSERR